MKNSVIRTASKLLGMAALLLFPQSALAAEMAGELMQWHTVTLSFEGPDTAENASPNPFTDYRLDVTFTHPASGATYVMPGYYAADGNAAHTGADQGNVWRVHLSPGRTGEWHWSAAFRSAPGVATSDDPAAAPSAGHFDGNTGQFTIAPSHAEAPDFRADGRLQYVGERYLRFAGSDRYFLKSGADAPENLLAYADFDGAFKTDGHKDELIKQWQPHVRDWQPGDPTWGEDERGKGLIGALNYLAGEGQNAVSFLTLNIAGDDRNVFPYTSYDQRHRLDVSRLAQWDIVFTHAQRLGLFLHFKTQEAENQRLLDDGDLGPERRLYYRELVARFGHHLALNWNLGEENGSWGGIDGQTSAQRRAMTQWFAENDPYRHHLVIHNGQSYDDLLGDRSHLTGISLQTHRPDFANVHDSVLHWIEASRLAGTPWAVACDEPGDALHGLVPDADDPTHRNAVRNALWGTLLAGGWGVEWYFGYEHDQSDLTAQDWRSRDKFWDQCRWALEFFEANNIPFWSMNSHSELIDGDRNRVFADPSRLYLVYLPEGNRAHLDLEGVSGRFTLSSYDPIACTTIDTGRTVKGNQQLPLSAEGGDRLYLLKVNE